MSPAETAWGSIEHRIADFMDLYLAVKSGGASNPPRVQRPGEKERAEARLEERKRRFNERQAAAALRLAQTREGETASV